MDSEILKIHEAYRQGSLTCAGLIAGRIGELEKSSHNSVNFLLKDMAMEMAAAADDRIRSGGELRALEGIPFGIKDVYMLQGINASGSSGILKNYKAPYTAAAIQKLLDAGAIPLAKENCDCFGHGSSNENSFFGPVRNALDEDLVPGGSSGGSAVNVAKGFTTFSIGGDTGGSIRQPSGYNRVYGLKPTYGRISRYGLMAYASSTDCVGPISRSLEDIRLLLNIMSGKDVRDQTTFESAVIPEDIFRDDPSVKKIRIGYYRNFIESDNLDEKIKRDFVRLLNVLKENGNEVEELEFFDDNILVSAYYVLAMAETASNLARLDGSVYGERVAGESIKDQYALTRSENLTEETRIRIVGGNQVLAHGYAEGIYQKARSLRNMITGSFSKDFRSVGIILSPVTPNTPPPLGSSLKNPMLMYLSDAYTVGFSLGGLPTLSAPLATDTGIQITAEKNGEGRILKFAKYLKDIL